MRLHHLYTALAAVALAAGGGCVIYEGPGLRVDTVRVTGESDFGLLDVEVHLFDMDTGRHLGCSGQFEGLEHVDYNDVTYRPDAWFREPWADVELPASELNGRDVEIQVVEDDAGRCPEPPSGVDDMIGISGPVDRGMIELAPMLSFGHVTALRLVIE